MSVRIAASFAVLLMTGCAVVQEKNPLPEHRAVPMPTCKGAADCEAKWSAARTFVIAHTSYKIENDSVGRLETYNPANEVTDGLRARVTRTIQPDGSYAIEAKFWCNNLIECKPSAASTTDDFNRSVGAAGLGEPAPTVAAAAPAPVPAAPTAVTPPVVMRSGADSQVDAETYIRDSEAAWAESVATSDTSVVKRILADDCVWVLDGRVVDKAHAIAEAAKGPGDFVSNHLDYAHVRIFGGTAIAQGSETWTRKSGKKGHFVWTDTWMRRDGQWQIVAAEDAVVPIDK
jgi:ketosteroid isomerase-like protein